MPTSPRTRRRIAVAAAAVLLVAAGVFTVVTQLRPLLSPGGCRAGTGRHAVSLDPEQASIAATIAGVAHQLAMPSRAVTVAYAAALQESKMHDLGYGDRDSVGIFQQRPSQGWGPARKLRDPVYASTRFFQALAGVRGYQRLPVYAAAQAVQRSADGYAYLQYEPMAAKLSAVFTGHVPHSVWCWSNKPPRGPAEIAAARAGLAKTFGSLAASRSAMPGDAPAVLIHPSHPSLGWAVAAWLVTHARRYRIHTVGYRGFQWRAAAGHAGWTRDNDTAAAAVRAS